MGKIIGIDLGTTTSEIAFMENDQPKIITDCFGNRIVPSVVGKKEDGTVVVGQVAYNQLISSPDRTMAEVKRLMGSDTMISLDDEKYLPHELSSLILKELKKYAEDYLGEEVVEAVITVPANFNNSQRKVTKMAGEMAGLKVERIINEPTAAAMAYGLNNYDKEEKILVYDLGGGTFDVSILEMFEGILDVKSSRGNDRLGGKDFDSRIEKYIEKEFEKTYNQNLYKGLDVKNKLSIKLRVKEAAINAKKELSTQLSTTINIPFITIIDNKPVSIGMELTRDKFNQLTKDLVISTTEKIDEALNKEENVIFNGKVLLSESDESIYDAHDEYMKDVEQKKEEDDNQENFKFDEGSVKLTTVKENKKKYWNNFFDNVLKESSVSLKEHENPYAPRAATICKSLTKDIDFDNDDNAWDKAADILVEFIDSMIEQSMDYFPVDEYEPELYKIWEEHEKRHE